MEHISIPATEGRLVRARTSDHVRVTTEDGCQVGDVFAFAADDPREWLSAAHTRGHLSRLFPAVGQQFVTNLRRPVLTLTADTSPGRHDMLLPACDPARYRGLGVSGWHASCAENLHTAMSTAGLPVDVVPQPVNVFMDIPVTEDGELHWHESPAGPGAAITFRAELDCVVVVSACPQDLSCVNGGTPKPLVLERYH